MKIKKIVIKRIPYEKQRYGTTGDYWFDKGTLHFRITAHDDNDFASVLVHELIESLLTRKRKIDWKKIDAFDKAHLELEGPGLDPRSPYHKEHMFACKIEAMVLKEFEK